MKIEFDLHGGVVSREWKNNDKQSASEAIQFIRDFLPSFPKSDWGEEGERITRRRWTTEERELVSGMSLDDSPERFNEMADQLNRTPSAVRAEVYRQHQERLEVGIRDTEELRDVRA